MREVEAWVEPERHDGCSSLGGALASEHGHLALAVHADCVIAGRQGIDAVEMIALDPILQLTRLIACVLADFEHGHDDDADRDWLLFRHADDRGGRHEKSYTNRSRTRHH
jgi:hypothetical protein